MIKDRHKIKGGIERKVLALVLVTILLSLLAYGGLTMYQSGMLSQLAAETSRKQQDTITDTTVGIMDQVVRENMERSSVLEAQITDDMFRSAKTRVMFLADYATEVFAHPENYTPHTYAPPRPENEGKLAAQVLMAEGVDPNDPEIQKNLGLVASMSETMISLCSVTDIANIYLGMPDGTFFSVSRNSGQWFLEDGSMKNYDVRTRHWYQQAETEGKLCFSDVEVDATTGQMNIVCAMPIYYPDGKLAAVAGADVYLNDIMESLGASDVEGGFRAAVNHDGHVLFTTSTEPEFQARISAEAADLRTGENAELGQLVTDALEDQTDIRIVKLGSGNYYMMGVPLKTVSWTLLTAFSEERAETPVDMLQEKYTEIQSEATSTYRKKANNSKTIAFICIAGLAALLLVNTVIVGKRIVRPLNKITKRITELGEENPEFKMEETFRTGDEIEVLAESFADLSHKTVEYVGEVRRVTAENERIGTELNLARRIQAEMLPNIFPPFPERTDMNIYASMQPAKEVGGDFYDFFLIDNEHLGLVMADVSGKGVPAALFMMAAKILVQNHTMNGGSPAEVLQKVNNQICQKNKEQMFVTVWLGILNLKTGLLTAANAGHEYPILQGEDGRYELVKDKHGFVIGGLENVRYKDYTLQMTRGMKLFVYTDGIPEATNEAGEFYGTERLLETLNEHQGEDPTELIHHIHLDLKGFVGNAAQFDDVTMMCVEFIGPEIVAEGD